MSQTTEDCKFCNRLGLPLLPLRLAYIPEGEDTLPKGMAGSAALLKPIVAGKYALRTITEGFVYSYDSRAHVGWRCFAATPDGRFKEIIVADDVRPEKTPKFQCTRAGHGVSASIISVENASQTSETWVGYFRTWLTKSARKLLRENDSLRQQTMIKINPKQLVTGGELPVTDGFRIDNAGNSLKQHVAEYGNPALAAQKYAYTCAAACDRKAEAEAQAQRMHQMSPGNAFALALPDDIGIVADIGKWRNFKAGELAKFEVDQKNLREKVVADIAYGLKQQMTDAGRAKDWGRYAKHLDMGKVDSVRSSYTNKIKQFEAAILKVSDDWCKWMDGERFWEALKVFDGDVCSVGVDMERCVNSATEGSGATPKEQQIWDKILTAKLESNRSALWLAFAAGDKKVLDFLKDKGDKANDIFKNARDGADNLAKWLEQRRKAALVRTATHDTGLLGSTIATQASRLFQTAPQQAQVLGLRIRIVVAARMDAHIAPYRLNVQARGLVAMSYETIWGPPTAKLSRTMLEARRLRVVQNMDGVILGAKANVAQMLYIDMWLPQSVVNDLDRQLNLPTGAAGGHASNVPALPKPAPNPFKAFLAWSKKTDAKLVGLGAALQLWNLSNTLGTLRTAQLSGDAAAVQEAWFGITSGISGLGGVTLEVLAKTVEARVVPAIAATTSTKLLTVVGWTTLAGGLLAMGAAWAEGGATLLKAQRLYRAGDDDASSAYRISGISFFASGAAGAAVAVANAGAAFAAAGITASSGGVAGAIVGMTGGGAVLLGIPVWGWIALGVLTLVAGVWFLFQGAQDEDTPLEIWLSRCCLRNEKRYATTDRIRYTSAAEEMTEFQQAVFGLQVTLEWVDKIGKDQVTVEVVMPGFGKNSDYAFALTLGNGSTSTPVDRKTSAMSSDPELQPRAQQHYLSAVPPGQKLIPLSDVLVLEEPIRLGSGGGTGTLTGSVRVNESYFNYAKLKFEYWPDIIAQPELKMTPKPGGVNFQMVAD